MRLPPAQADRAPGRRARRQPHGRVPSAVYSTRSGDPLADPLEEFRKVELVVVRIDQRQALKALPCALLAVLELAGLRGSFPELDQPLVSEHEAVMIRVADDHDRRAIRSEHCLRNIGESAVHHLAKTRLRFLRFPETRHVPSCIRMGAFTAGGAQLAAPEGSPLPGVQDVDATLTEVTFVARDEHQLVNRGSREQQRI